MQADSMYAVQTSGFAAAVVYVEYLIPCTKIALSLATVWLLAGYPLECLLDSVYFSRIGSLLDPGSLIHPSNALLARVAVSGAHRRHRVSAAKPSAVRDMPSHQAVHLHRPVGKYRKR
jgi:hypothetical protein